MYDKFHQWIMDAFKLLYFNNRSISFVLLTSVILQPLDTSTFFLTITSSTNVTTVTTDHSNNSNHNNYDNNNNINRYKTATMATTITTILTTMKPELQ